MPALGRLMPGEDAQPPSIHRAMRYSVQAGGKRVRPSCASNPPGFLRGRDASSARRLRSRIIHTYSLIHDDLPALDNDDLRRGKPTCHKKFGEATAILAGDALLTLAFATLADAPIDPARRVAILSHVAASAGTSTAWWADKWLTSKRRDAPLSPRSSNTFTVPRRRR